MKRSVTFKMEGWTSPITGYEGGSLPLDKAAEVVLSSDQNPVTSIVVHFANDVRNVFTVLHSNDETIGAPCEVAKSAIDSYLRMPRCFVTGMRIGGDGRCALHQNDILAANLPIPRQTGDVLGA